MGLYVGCVTKQGMETLAKCKVAYNEMSCPTPRRIADAVGMCKGSILRLWPKLSGGKSWIEDLKTKVRAYIMVYPDSTPEEASDFTELPLKSVLSVWGEIIAEVRSTKKEDALLRGVTQIPEFIPKAKRLVSSDGKECIDVSEFYGIVENGGECYKGVHYTVPKGYPNTFKGSVSDFYI